MKDPKVILFAYQFEIMRAVLADNEMDADWFYEVLQDYLSANVTLKDFRDMLNRKKFIRPELKIRLWFEIRKFCSDAELGVVDFFIQGNLIRFKNAVLHPHRRKAKHSMFERLKKSEYAFLVEDDPIQNQS